MAHFSSWPNAMAHHTSHDTPATLKCTLDTVPYIVTSQEQEYPHYRFCAAKSKTNTSTEPLDKGSTPASVILQLYSIIRLYYIYKVVPIGLLCVILYGCLQESKHKAKNNTDSSDFFFPRGGTHKERRWLAISKYAFDIWTSKF